VTTDDPLLARIIARAEQLRADDRHRDRTPFGWTTFLAETAERVSGFTYCRIEAAERENLAEIGATAIHCAALALVVAQIADEARKGVADGTA
jgi:hypothetical protein